MAASGSGERRQRPRSRRARAGIQGAGGEVAARGAARDKFDCHSARPQYSSTILYQVSYHIQLLFFSKVTIGSTLGGAGPGGAILVRGRQQQRTPRRVRGRPGHGSARAEARARARPHPRFVLPLIHFIPDLLTYLVPLFLKRQCDRTLGTLTASGMRAVRAGCSRWSCRRRMQMRSCSLVVRCRTYTVGRSEGLCLSFFQSV